MRAATFETKSGKKSVSLKEVKGLAKADSNPPGFVTPWTPPVS
jgi:hypothetical protein